MPTVHGLPDTKREMEAVYVRSLSAIPKVIRARKCATAADDNGAMSVWIDDHGHYRGESYRHLRTLELKTFKTLKATKAWYRKWLKKIQ